MSIKIGIIGGSGLYKLDGIANLRMVKRTTPLGDASDDIMVGNLGATEVCFLPRHGSGHRLLPSEINHRANIMAMKMLGVERIISISAVGSLKQEYAPRDIVLPDQYFDRTKRWMDQTFFGKGIVAHVSFGHPTCEDLRAIIAETANELIAVSGLDPKPKVHDGGTYVNMEGPAFSTKAESLYYRKMGFDVIGMTSLAEAKLCREAEICYQPVAMVTDYDCWHESEEEVNIDMLLGHLRANTNLAKKLIVNLVPKISASRKCKCSSALKSAILTDLTHAPEQTLADLKPILAKYISKPNR